MIVHRSAFLVGRSLATSPAKYYLRSDQHYRRITKDEAQRPDSQLNVPTHSVDELHAIPSLNRAWQRGGDPMQNTPVEHSAFLVHDSPAAERFGSVAEMRDTPDATPETKPSASPQRSATRNANIKSAGIDAMANLTIKMIIALNGIWTSVTTSSRRRSAVNGCGCVCIRNASNQGRDCVNHVSRAWITARTASPAGGGRC